MTNETLGIAGVFGFTGILLFLRHLLLSVGKRRRKPSLTRESRATKRGPHPVDARNEKASARSPTNRAMWPNQPGSFPRFRI